MVPKFFVINYNLAYLAIQVYLLAMLGATAITCGYVDTKKKVKTQVHSF